MSAEPLVSFVRPLLGTVGETRRVCHVVPAREGAQPPAVLMAYCGTQLITEAVEFLPGAQGQPCFMCLMRAPLPDREPDAVGEGGSLPHVGEEPPGHL